MSDSEYIVILPRLEGSHRRGWYTQYYSDHQRFETLPLAVGHAEVDLRQTNDFLIGEIKDQTLVAIPVGPPFQRAEIAKQLGLWS